MQNLERDLSFHTQNLSNNNIYIIVIHLNISSKRNIFGRYIQNFNNIWKYSKYGELPICYKCSNLS